MKESMKFLQIDTLNTLEDEKVPPLEPWQCRTKLYGLKVLEKLAEETGDKVLSYKVYEKAEQISPADFLNPQEGRFIIRTDPRTNNPIDITQSDTTWSRVPRLNLNLEGCAVNETEKAIQKWISEILKNPFLLLPDLRFIVHKVRNLDQYLMHVKIVRSREGELYISITDPKKSGAMFRSILSAKELGVLFFNIDEKGTVYIDGDYTQNIIHKSGLEILVQNITKMAEAIIAFARQSGHNRFESSAVTYNDAPDVPEYYDLRFVGSDVDL